MSGKDRATYLHGLLTNDIAGLKAGDGCYAAYLTPQGRMITDLFVYELGDAMLLTMDGSVKASLLARLEQLIFTEEVTLRDVSATFAQITVLGPLGARALADVLPGTSAEEFAALKEHGNRRIPFGDHSIVVTRAVDAGERGFDLYVTQQQTAALRAAFISAGIPTLDPGTAEAIRIESGWPMFGRDMDGQTIPLEAGIESRAISFTKGCYVGQEVIIRVLHRGHGRVARKLVGLVFSGHDVPAAGSRVRAHDADVGFITSSTMSPALARPIALGYVHHNFMAPGTPVEVNGGEAVVTALPFVPQPS